MESLTTSCLLRLMTSRPNMACRTSCHTFARAPCSRKTPGSSRPYQSSTKQTVRSFVARRLVGSTQSFLLAHLLMPPLCRQVESTQRLVYDCGDMLYCCCCPVSTTTFMRKPPSRLIPSTGDGIRLGPTVPTYRFPRNSASTPLLEPPTPATMSGLLVWSIQRGSIFSVAHIMLV